MRVERVAVEETPDSRGKPTIAVIVAAGDGTFRASIPSGKSTGSREAHVASVASAKHSAETVSAALRGRAFSGVGKLDRFLIALDGTPRKEKLGGNLTLGTSIAFARALAAEEGRELWETLREEFFAGAKERAPIIFSNLINGGAHANNNLAIQEYLALARTAGTVEETVRELTNLYHALGESLKTRFRLSEIRLGDEGGYSLDFSDNFEPLAVLEELIDASDLENEFLLGLDAAASHFYREGNYEFEGKAISREALAEVYAGYFAKSKLLLSIEDPFAEDDAEGFRALQAAFPTKWVVGDDLTTTNPVAIEEHVKNGAVNAVIVKPNQIGTVSETCEAVNVARRGDAKVIVSHRSGETPDTFIIHLAKACGADGVKIGAPVSNRLSKFEELVRLYP